MRAPSDHRAEAESALANAQRNPVMSADQWFLSARVHAMLALEARLTDIASALGKARDPLLIADAKINHAPNGATDDDSILVVHSEAER